ncbi:MAG: hypothetical protein ACFB15_03760 [Cyclobacteriaceae bacterium]
MKKVIVVIASVLKPVNDTRMYEKMAQSLISIGKFSVNIIGFSSITHSDFRDIKFHPIFQFKRREYRRIVANVHFFFRLLNLRPAVAIITTPELSPAILLFGYFFPATKIVYDIRENYQRNLFSNHQGKSRLRRLLIILVTRWENLLIRCSDQIIVAEQGYLLEKPQLASVPKVVIENKVVPPSQSFRKSKLGSPIKLLYTGTVSTPYGIWDALRFSKQLHDALAGKLRFEVVGHVTQSDTYQRLIGMLSEYPWIQATISENPIPHSTLLKKIEEADFGIVCHQLLPSIWNCFPTRIWEYMAYRLPFFLQNHHPWVSYCQPWQCCIPVDFSMETWPMENLISRVFKEDFYQNSIPSDIYWEKEKFLSTVAPLATNP